MLLLGLGLLVSWWILYYTSYFPVFGGLLGLGGLFAWIAFVSGLIHDDRKEQLQQAFERRVLLSRRASWAVLIMAAALVAGLGFFGSVEIAAVRDAVGRTVEVHPAGTLPRALREQPGGESPRPLREVFLPARGVHRLALPTPWFGSRSYRIEASGLPSRLVEVTAWRRIPIVLPDSFLAQPVLLVWPSGETGNALRNLLNAGARSWLIVSVATPGEEGGPKRRVLKDYRGQSVWIGYDGRFGLPDEVIARWSREEAHREVAQQWRAPLELPDLELAPQQVVEVVINVEGLPEDELVRERIEVGHPRLLADFPQTEVLDGR